MKNLKVTTTILAMTYASLTAMSCNEQKKEIAHDDMQTEVSYNEMSAHSTNLTNNSQDPKSTQIVADYMSLKDALVATNKEEASEVAKKLVNSLSGFDVSSYTAEQQNDLNAIIAKAKEHAEHIVKSEMDHQREHFKTLSKAIMDMVAITGTEATLYQQFCPMYDKGSSWLSLSKDIRNPYFGDKMLACGRVEKVIN